MTLKGLVIDMDGVLWHGDTALPGIGEFFSALTSLRLPFVLATNNATITVRQYVEKLARFGVPVTPEQVITSPVATVGYLQQHYPAGTTIYAVGEIGLTQTLSDAGYTVIGPDEVKAGQTAPVVVGGLVRQSLSYELLAMGTLLVRQGAAFVATNYDLTLPTEFGELPGAGAVLSVIARASGVEPTVIGKPYPTMFEESARRLGTSPEETLMVGDRLDTDIDGAHAAGLKTALVLTGVSQRKDIGEIPPDYVVDDLFALIKVLNSVSPI